MTDRFCSWGRPEVPRAGCLPRAFLGSWEPLPEPEPSWPWDPELGVAEEWDWQLPKVAFKGAPVVLPASGGPVGGSAWGSMEASVDNWGLDEPLFAPAGRPWEGPGCIFTCPSEVGSGLR